jgi:hypothetical protein
MTATPTHTQTRPTMASFGRCVVYAAAVAIVTAGAVYLTVRTPYATVVAGLVAYGLAMVGFHVLLGVVIARDSRHAATPLSESTVDESGGPVALDAVDVRVVDRRADTPAAAGIAVIERIRQLPAVPAPQSAGDGFDRAGRERLGQTW